MRKLLSISILLTISLLGIPNVFGDISAYHIESFKLQNGSGGLFRVGKFLKLCSLSNH